MGFKDGRNVPSSVEKMPESEAEDDPGGSMGAGLLRGEGVEIPVFIPSIRRFLGFRGFLGRRSCFASADNYNETFLIPIFTL
jgi:hypothetical protein